MTVPTDRELMQAYATTWDSPAGRLVLTDLLLDCGAISNTQGPVAEGKRAVAIRILRWLGVAGTSLDLLELVRMDYERSRVGHDHDHE
jgi:hypothetical protein